MMNSQRWICIVLLVVGDASLNRLSKLEDGFATKNLRLSKAKHHSVTARQAPVEETNKNRSGLLNNSARIPLRPDGAVFKEQGSHSQVSKKLNEILKNYDKSVRPNDTGDPVEVLVEFKVMAIGKIREEDMDYTIDIFFRQWWQDERLSHNIDKVFTMASDPSNIYWTPDTYFVNVKKSSYHYVSRDNMRVMVWPDGKIYFSARITLTASCNMDLSMYPLDTQRCELIIESYAYTIEDVRYYWRNRNARAIEINAGEMAQFDLKKVTTYKKESKNSKGSFDSLRVFFTFKRRTSYFIIQYYLPCAFVVLLSWLGFWINRNAVPARVSLTITCILTSMLLFSSVNSSLPRISYLKSVDYYLITSFAFIVASTVEYALVLNVLDANADLPTKDLSLLERGYKAPKNEDDCPANNLNDVMDHHCHAHCRTLAVHAHCRSYKTSTMRLRHKISLDTIGDMSDHATHVPMELRRPHFIDRYSRKIFPALYVVYNLAYWFYYIPFYD